jgi:hypothetical protein
LIGQQFYFFHAKKKYPFMKKILSDITTKEPVLKSTNIIMPDEASFDALLDEINKQKRQNQSLQAEISALRNTEVRLQKSVERLRVENQDLEQQVKKMTQRVRELEIEISLPVNERTLEINRTIIAPIPQPKTKENIFSRFAVVAILMLCTVAIVWKWTNGKADQNLLPKTASVSQALNEVENVSTPAPSVVQVAAPVVSTVTIPAVLQPASTVVNNATVTAAPAPNTANAVATPNATPEEGYLLIDNPLNKDFMVRVYTSYQRGARELAFVNTGDKFRIRAQSPEKMRRQYVMNGKKISVEDYFYKISDKEQWVFGLFTTKRTATF